MEVIIIIAVIYIIYKVVSGSKAKSQMSNADVKASQQSAIPRQPILRSNPHRILICDDAAFMRTQLKDILTQDGYKVVAEAQNGLEAIERYSEFKPDLVFMDITMPTMDGIDATRKIKEMDSHANIVVCSAMGQRELVMEAIRSGAKDFIVKPFAKEAVLQAVVKIFEPWRTATPPEETGQSQTANTTPPVQAQRTEIKGYQNLLEEYYRKYKNQVFQNRTLSEIQQKISFERTLAEIKHDMKIIRNEIILLDETATPSMQSQTVNTEPPVQAKSIQSQTVNTTPPVQEQNKQSRTEDTTTTQSVLDTQRLFSYVKAMPVKWGYANPNVSPNKELQQLCNSLLTGMDISKCYNPDAWKGMEYIIQKKRARTPDKPSYNKAMETNMLFEIYEYSYCMNALNVLMDRKNDTVKVNASELIKLIDEDCHKRLRNLEYEKRNNPALQDMLQKYQYDTQKVKMVVNDYVDAREYDYIYSYLMTTTLLNIINGVLNTEMETADGYQPTLKIVRQHPASDLMAALHIYISSAVGIAFNSYTNGGSIPHIPQ